jgi:integrase
MALPMNDILLANLPTAASELTPPLSDHVAGEVGPAVSPEPDDETALHTWLGFAQYRNPRTHRSYRTEVTRFRLFLQTVHAGNPARPENTLLRDATEMDIASYEAQLLGRTRAGDSVVPLYVPRELLERSGRTSQPFIHDGPHLNGMVHHEPIARAKSSVNQAITILHALYQYWMRPDPVTKRAYVGANPVKRVKGATNRSKRQIDRNFPPEGITAMLGTIALERATLLDQPDNNKRALDLQRLDRLRWIVALLFGLWGRRSEIASLRMNDFHHDGSIWYARLCRKGGKEQDVPVADWVMKELMTYRQSLALAPLPNDRDSAPAIGRLRRYQPKGQTRASAADQAATINSDTIYREVASCASAAAAAVRSAQVLNTLDEVQRELLASRLEKVTPHWFRHSGATIAINSGVMSLLNASKMLGHTSTAITSEMYHHQDSQEMAQSLQKLGGHVFQGN